jgi:CHAT domain-containing protein
MVWDKIQSLFANFPKFWFFAIPPDRVDWPYDQEPLQPNEDYCRIWLAEVQWQDDPTTIPLVYGETRFGYGGRTLSLPSLVRLSAYSSPYSSSNLAHSILNIAVTPLFPYRGGPVELHMVLQHVRASNDISTYLKTLEDISELLRGPEFSKMLPLTDPLSNGMTQLLSHRDVRMDQGVQLSFDNDPGTLMPLRPGYFVMLRGDGTGFEPRGLCVINGSLLYSSHDGNDFHQTAQPLPASITGSLLFRIERVKTRDDWMEMSRINQLVHQAYDSMYQGELESVQAIFPRVAVEIWGSADFTQADRRRMIEAIRTTLEDIHNTLGVEVNSIRAAAVQAISSHVEQSIREEEQIRQVAEKTAAEEPYADSSDDLILLLDCDLNEAVRASLIGIGSGVNESLKGGTVLRFDPYKHARQADRAFSADWRLLTKHQGEQLSQEIFGDTAIAEIYSRSQSVVDGDEKLHLRFLTPRDFLRVPFEYLVSKQHRDYMLLRHPLARIITGIMTRKSPLSLKFFNKLYREGKPLSVLLVASDTPPAIPQADEEIASLADALPGLFGEKGIAVQVKSVLTEQATYEAVKKELSKGEYHILHYAGHGVYDENTPEKSFLPLWGQPGRKGEVKELTVPELQWALESRKSLLFVYLSCCVGAAQGEPSHLIDNDFLGITDGLIQAQVPAILSFRWPAIDQGAKKLALSFYSNLAESGQIDTALLLARKELAQDRENSTWLSPLLILQAIL